jgi:hypothetical protein
MKSKKVEEAAGIENAEQLFHGMGKGGKRHGKRKGKRGGRRKGGRY